MKLCPQCDTGYPDTASACPTHGGLLSEIRDLRPGMLIRKTYRIIRLLGKGGMGAVYLAHHELMDAPRALKFLSADLTADEAFTRRFMREGRMLRQVRHKNVVDCGDLERAEDETLFFAMEFVDGPDLRGLLTECGSRLDPTQALSIARGIAQGLGAAHALGMVHRDIKPENILMAGDENGWLPKIADFGIVATAETSTIYKTTRGSLLTPPYAAPEQWRGTRANELDGRTDLYALGGVLFEMLTGRTVFDADSYEGWLFQHLDTPPLSPSSLRPELAGWQGLDALVLRLLAKDREQRPRDVAELLPLLDAVRPPLPQPRRVTVVEQQPQPAAPAPIPLLTPTPAPESKPHASIGQVTRLSPDPEPFAENLPAKGRHIWRWEFLIFAVLAMVFFISWYENKQKQDQAAADQPLQSAQDTPPQPASQGASSPPRQEATAAYQQAGELQKQGSYKEAAPLLKKACDGGVAGACDELAYLYEYGPGVELNFAQAKIYYSLACDMGNATGCSRLGDLYSNGQGVTEDLAKAATLYAKACGGADAAACNNLGAASMHGDGVPQDNEKARQLFKKGCGLGSESACEWLKRVP